MRHSARTMLSLGAFAIFCVHIATAASAGKRHFNETMTVEDGVELVVLARSGLVLLSTWDSDEIKVRATHDEEAQIRVSEQRRNVKVFAKINGDDAGDVQFDITVPRWMDVSVEGHSVDVECENMGGRVEIEIFDGDIYLEGGRERTNLTSINGDIRVENGNGRVTAFSPHGSVTILDTEGPLVAETVSGDIRLAGVASDNVEAISVSGDVLYDGSVVTNGNYYLESHDGEIQIGLSPDADVSVLVITAKGEFSTDFDVRLEKGRSGDRLEFTLGDGSAKLRAESFAGDIEFFDPKHGRRKRGR